jgi:nucleotide-binding universal stress UspA family protein
MSAIKHILVATDLTGRSLYALERAMQLKVQSGAAASVLHVIEPGLSTKLQERRHADALAVLQDWREILPEIARQDLAINVMVGEPFATIVEELEIHQMDLVVVGRPGKHGLRDLFLGTTTERVVRYSPQPVLMVAQHPNGPYKRVLVAMDLSAGAARALALAYRIAPDAKIKAVHAWQSPFVGLPSKDTSAAGKDKERLLELDKRRIKDILQALPQSASPDIAVVEGDAHTVIRNEIGLFNADLLVMGTHSRSRLSTAIVGSLAHTFLAEGACDVLVARA